jgi:hypothetical protein
MQYFYAFQCLLFVESVLIALLGPSSLFTAEAESHERLSVFVVVRGNREIGQTSGLLDTISDD